MKPIGYYNYTVIATYIGLAAAGVGCFFAMEAMTKAALICLMTAGAIDMIDGKIASTRKRTTAEKQFGIQIDSLCDLVSFGVLPVMLLNCFTVPDAAKKTVGVLFVLAAVIRLAYFNVTEAERQAQTTGRREYYEGLPVTSTALLLPAVCLLGPLFHDRAYLMGMIYLSALAVIGVLFLAPFRLKKPGGKGIAALTAVGTLVFFSVIFVI